MYMYAVKTMKATVAKRAVRPSTKTVTRSHRNLPLPPQCSMLDQTLVAATGIESQTKK